MRATRSSGGGRSDTGHLPIRFYHEPGRTGGWWNAVNALCIRWKDMLMNTDGKTKPRRRVLIVEDELMIRMLLEDMLDDLGFEVAASAGRLDEAVRLVNDTEFDVAILDMNLNGQAVAPVVEVLEKRGLPYVFATG